MPDWMKCASRGLVGMAGLALTATVAERDGTEVLLDFDRAGDALDKAIAVTGVMRTNYGHVYGTRFQAGNNGMLCLESVLSLNPVARLYCS